MYLKVNNCSVWSFFIERWLNKCQAVIKFLFGQLKLIWYICEPNWSNIYIVLNILMFDRRCAGLRFISSRDLINVKRFGLSLAFCNTCMKPQHWNTACMGFVLLWCVLCGKCLDHFKKRVVSCPKWGALQFVAFKSVFEFGSWYVLHTCCMFFC